MTTVDAKEQWLADWSQRYKKDTTRCTRCLYDEDTPAITFDADGVCNYCQMHDSLAWQPPDVDWELVEMVKKRLGLTDAQFEEHMTQPVKTYKDFKTHKRLFERLRPLFWLLSRADLIPRSFYLKYTSKKNI